MAEGLDRFTDAQARVWETVKAELQAGRKSSHWMWYIFPQLESLGQSPTAKHYGMRDISEATAYLAHPVLGPRLAEVAGLLLPHAGTPPEKIMGGVGRDEAPFIDDALLNGSQGRPGIRAGPRHVLHRPLPAYCRGPLRSRLRLP